ncbi:MAG TPA: 3-hydroxyacyl-CoA dehydrogenase NAD-binding domain-containing protein, partial [Chloroflexia bacterium]
MPGKIAVLGAGTMGAGIAQLAAQSGFDVLLYDLKDDFLQRGLGNIR